MKISVCVITKNEEKNIGRLLKSCEGSADEIIVVDSESTDDTVRIAERCGAKVYTRPWTNDFAAARNFAVEQASGDWVIILDADEYLQEGCAGYVRDEIARADREGFHFLLTHNHDIRQDTGEITGSYYGERIFKRIPSIRYHNAIHEYLWNSDGGMHRAYTDKFSIFHTGYEPSLIKNKLERNLALLLSDACEDSLMRHFYLAEVYTGLGRYEEALNEVQGLLASPGFADSLKDGQKMFRVYVFRIKAMLALGYEQTEAEKAAEEALASFGEHPEIRAALSDLYRHFGQTDKAIENYETALWIGKSGKLSVYDDMFSVRLSDRYVHLADLYKEQEDPGSECRCLLQALSENKKNEQALFAFFVLTKELSVQDIEELLTGLYDEGLPADRELLMKIACMAGSNVFFMDRLLKLSESGDFRIDGDPGIFGRLLFLQGEYDEMSAYAEGKEQESIYARILFEAKLAKAAEAQSAGAIGQSEADMRGDKAEEEDPWQKTGDELRRKADMEPEEWAAAITADLLQSGREDLIRLMAQKGMEVCDAAVFARYRRTGLYEDLRMHDHKE